MKRETFLTMALGAAFWLVLARPLSQTAESSGAHGLAVGAKAPGFTLKDKDGKEHTLAEFQKKPKFVALLFYRSADW